MLWNIANRQFGNQLSKMKQVQLRVDSNISCVIVLLCHWGWWP